MKHKDDADLLALAGQRCLLALICCLLSCLLMAAQSDTASWQDTLACVSVEAPFQKQRPINHLVYGSGRSFSTEDAYRYAGSLGEIGRMVRSYAGVACPNDSRNDISVRGNSPSHMLWRIDGYEMTNPNHFASFGLTGSSVSLLNSQLITNSDFLTGAFPAEYGNVLSGVFDLHLRQTPQHRRFRVQTGWNGFELAAEGPWSASEDVGGFQVAYRYSFLDILSKLGMNRGINPKFQDFTLKLDRNLSARWSLNALLLWGISHLDLSENEACLSTASSSDFAGLCLRYDDESAHKAEVRIYANRSVSRSDIERLDESLYHEHQKENRYSLVAKWEHRPRPQGYLQCGAGVDVYDMRFFQRRAALLLWHGYAQEEYRFSEQWKLTAGLRLQGKLLAQQHRVKPELRAALQWRISENQRVALSYGRHHQTQVHTLYLYREAEADNLSLDFSQADHVVLSYDYAFAPQWRCKVDAYYQDLRNMAIEEDPASSYAAMNMGADFYIPMKAGLVNAGKGRNYGLELTVEKFLHQGYYAMANVHAFRSLYQAADGIWRSSAYDLRYQCNLLGGYQFAWGKAYLSGVDVKWSASGGRPETPWGGEAYSARYPPYSRLDVRVFLQYRAKRLFYEFAVDLQNVGNRKNLLYEVYDPQSKLYTYYYQTLFSPMYTFSVLF